MKKILSLSLVAAVLVGCGGGGKTMVGNWSASGGGMDSMPPGSKATMAFQDKTFSLNVATEQTAPAGKVKMNMDFSGEYKVDGDKITLTFKDIKTKVDGDPSMQIMLDAAMKGQKEGLLANMNKSNSGVLAWDGTDTVTIKSSNDKNLVLTRAK